MISMIWAMDEDNLIGANNKMPWHIKEDLLYYKEKTKDKIVVMGYNTYISMTGYYKNRPFPYVKCLVLTHREINDERIEVVKSIDDILKIDSDVFIVGGKNVYKQFLPYATYLYISYIKGHHEGDTYIDFLDLKEFDLISSDDHPLVKYTIYQRRK